MLFKFNESPKAMGPGFGNSDDLGFKDCKSKISMGWGIRVLQLHFSVKLFRGNN